MIQKAGPEARFLLCVNRLAPHPRLAISQLRPHLQTSSEEFLPLATSIQI
jgi:hypothetical protein